MLASFLIMLREGLEAALVTGIIATYLRQTGRSAWMPLVWVGIFLAVALSLFVGAALQWVSAEFPQKYQELFEACVGLVAVVILTSMVFWMRKAARSIKAELHDSIDAALSAPKGAAWALIGLVFFAVAREGLESIFFLLAIFQQSSGPGVPLAALAGVLVSVAAGFAIYAGGLRLNLRRFFRWTGVFILFVAAGILASALGNLHEAGLWNGLQTPAYDLSRVLPVSSVVGTILSGILGYQESPSVGEILLYVIFLGVSLFFFLKPPRPGKEASVYAPSPATERPNAGA
ncbi:iron uptake transporter permease EfeU [Afifella marina]|uniref:High-affinity iron transporter n=1 Tax=Afifella marina DSM 2698 TaxID=1120955 RepID=A0A1G5PB08_AFIMA|nr:iron uptake transporter permease EfeU [Afifella marina]MBK1624356.1 iron transporter [Afifella marina DSM 2698]MBK1628088.1 iron transporter [Afifella marina]MBK5916522.1 iron transporter [Afifella marina]RAI18897.1 iron transporter [Afifella marina DSM 2698]SCZ46251.1 high-affinity iron transporter [Afifella marina DSM 2698]